MKTFENYIFDAFGQDKNYDRLRHNLLNVWETMSIKHKSFGKMSIKRQFEYCNTIGTIALQTQLQYMNENRPISAPKDIVYNYSMDRNWKEVTKLELPSTLTAFLKLTPAELTNKISK